MKRELQTYVTAAGLALSVLASLLSGGCSSTLRETTSDIPPETRGALSKVYTGMTEHQARQIMEPVSLNWGRVASATGSNELLFQVSNSKQVRLTLEPRGMDARFWSSDVIALFQRISFKPVFVVAYIGQPEPKSDWKLDGDRTVPR